MSNVCSKYNDITIWKNSLFSVVSLHGGSLIYNRNETLLKEPMFIINCTKNLKSWFQITLGVYFSWFYTNTVTYFKCLKKRISSYILKYLYSLYQGSMYSLYTESD